MCADRSTNTMKFHFFFFCTFRHFLALFATYFCLFFLLFLALFSTFFVPFGTLGTCVAFMGALLGQFEMPCINLDILHLQYFERPQGGSICSISTLIYRNILNFPRLRYDSYRVGLIFAAFEDSLIPGRSLIEIIFSQQNRTGPATPGLINN